MAENATKIRELINQNKGLKGEVYQLRETIKQLTNDQRK